jgi:hypothetical protein
MRESAEIGDGRREKTYDAISLDNIAEDSVESFKLTPSIVMIPSECHTLPSEHCHQTPIEMVQRE